MVAIIFWMLVVQSAIGLAPALLVWRTPTAAVWPWIVVIALCGTYSHYCMAQALRHAAATVIVPMDFLRVPLTAVAGWLVYDERIDLFTVIGAGLDPRRQPPQPAPTDRGAEGRQHGDLDMSAIPFAPARRAAPAARRAGAGCRRRTPGSTTRCCSRWASSSSARSAG